MTATNQGTVTMRAVNGVWSSGPCAALEHAFELRLPDEPDFVQRLGRLVLPLRGPASGVERTLYEIEPCEGSLPYRLVHEANQVTAGSRAEDFAMMLSWHINRSVIARSHQRYVLLHCAAVCRDGVTVLLPAEQDCGKTTTTAGLLRAGFDYVTDEAVALDPATGRVRAFPKTLSLDPGSWPLFPQLEAIHSHPWVRQWHVPAEDLGATSRTGWVEPPSVVVFPRYRAGAQTSWTACGPGEALRAMAQLTFEFRADPGRNLRALGRVVSHASLARLTIGSLGEAVEAVKGLIDAHNRRTHG